MAYKELTKEKGFEFLPKIWTVEFHSDEDYFPNPFAPRDPRLRCFFDTKQDDMLVYIHLNEKCKQDKVLLESIANLSTDIYLFGAYNQINVVQIRAKGELGFVADETKERIMLLMQKRLQGEDIGDALRSNPSQNEKQKALEFLSGGTMFCFKATSFAHDGYERG